jgi:hypothetical protein
MIFPIDSSDSNSIRCKAYFCLVGDLHIDINVSDTLEFIVYHAVLLYLHYRKENVSIFVLIWGHTTYFRD